MTQQQKGRNKGRSTDSRSSNGRDKSLSFTKPSMTKQEILASGEQAASLLNSPAYNLAVNSVVDDLGSEILRTEPHEHNRREWLYSQGAAIGRVNVKLMEFVQMAQAIHMDEMSEEERAQHREDEMRGFPQAGTE